MSEDIKLQQPAQVHATSPLPYDYEAQQTYPVQKNKIRTWDDTVREWKHGSKSRVVTYYLKCVLIGFISGGIVGMIIGLSIRYS